MLRQLLLFLSRRKDLEEFLRQNPLAREAAARFVAGETRAEVLETARRLQAEGFRTTLHFLGDEAADFGQAEATAAEYTLLLDESAACGLDAGISVRLSSLGLCLDEELAYAHLLQVVRHADRSQRFVRVDTESAAWMPQALALLGRVHRQFPNAGMTLPAHLRRSSQDVDLLNRQGISVRLVKGASPEPEETAFQDPEEIYLYFMRLLETLFRDGFRPAIATHDEKLIEYAIDMAFIFNRREEEYEFQMLYGIRSDLQQRLRDEGYRVRVYLPYGTNWFGYFMNRLAERPAALWDLLRDLKSP